MSGALQAVFQNQRSFGAAPDAQFNYVTMLLHGDGTNGAQNNTFLDGSTNNFTITRNGNTTQGSFSPYGSNWSNYFTSSNNSYTRFTGLTAIGTNDYTIEMWFFAPSDITTGGFGVMFDSNSADLAGDGALIVFNSSVLNFKFIGNIAAPVSASCSVGVWHHVAMSKSGTGTSNVSCYLDGVRVGQTTYTTSLASTVANIGIYAGLNSYGFTGYISNVRMVSGTALYSGTSITVPTSPLTAISGTTLLTTQSNRFVNSNNATPSVNGTPSVQRFNPFGTATAYSTSVIGGSGYFDGSGDYLVIPNGGGSALDMGTGNCTIEMWVYPDTQVTSFPSMFAPKTGFSTGTFYIRYQGSRFGIYWSGVGDPFFESASTYPPNSWYHVAVVRSGTTFTLYVNGASAGTGTTSTTLNLAVGGEVWLGNNTSASCDYKGLLSDVRVVKGTAVYTAAFTPPTSPLTAISGTSLLTNMVNGAIFDNAMMNNLETVGNAQISTSVVKYGTGSLAFDGTGDSLLSTGTQNAAFGTGDFTIEMWLYSNTTSPTYQGLMDSRPSGGASANAFLIYMASGGTLYYFSNSSNIVSYSSISTNTWTHVAITRSSSSLRLFINGTISGSAVSNTTNLTQTGIIIGNTWDGYSLNGYIDDLRITKGYARYTATFTPPTAALLDIGPT